MSTKSGGGRNERLAAALKENLRRRKAQAKAKGAAEAEAHSGSQGDADIGEAPAKRPKDAPKRL